MGDSEYTKLSLPLYSESNPKDNSRQRTAAKLIAGISGLVIFGYVMSATYFSAPEASAINLNSSEARLQELVDQYQLELASSPVKVANFGNANQFYPALSMSKDNSLAAFLNLRNKIEVWDVQKKELVAKFTHSDNQVSKLVFTPDRKYLLSIANNDSFIKIWDLATKSLYGQIEDDNKPSELFVTRDSRFVVYSTFMKVSVCEITSLTNYHSIERSGYGMIVDIALTPDGKYLAMGDYYGSIDVYDLSTMEKITTLNNEASPNFLKLSDDGKILANGDYSSKATKVWNLETGKLITKIQHRGGVSDVELSPDGRFVCSASYDETATVYDLKANKIFTKIRKYVASFTFTKDSKFLLLSSGNLVKVLDLERKNEVATLKHLKGVSDIYQSENGEYLLVSTYWSVYLWNLKNLYN